MSEEARRFRLGLFVIGGLVLLALGVFALTAGRLFRRTHTLYCYFQENVQGLEQGGTVVRGRDVAIGHEFDPTSYSMPIVMDEWYAIV